MEASVLHLQQAPGQRSGRLLRLRTDDQLVALYRLGSDDAFRVIHDRYRQRLLAYTRQMLGGSQADAEDALQDVFVRAAAALRGDDRPVTLRAWLYRVAHNRCIDELRRPVPTPADVLDLSRGPALLDPLDAAQRREDLRRLVQDVRRLPVQQRSALLLRELDGLSYAELADVLGVTIPAVKSLLVRARGGLVAASQARDTACADIRADLVAADGRGVRCSGRSARHLLSCPDCRGFRHELRAARAGFAALSPGGGPLLALAKVLGIGGAVGGGGAAAAGGGAAIGTTTLVGGATSVAAAKVAAVVCTVAVVGGGAAEVQQRLSPERDRARPAAARTAPAARPARPAPRAPAAVLLRERPAPARAAAPHATATSATRKPVAPAARPPAKALAATAAATPAAAVDDDPTLPAIAVDGTGGAGAPAEDALPDHLEGTGGGEGAADEPTDVSAAPQGEAVAAEVGPEPAPQPAPARPPGGAAAAPAS